MSSVIHSIEVDGLLSVIPHVARLNNWIRAPGYRGDGYARRNVIYHFKNEAIKAAIAAGIVTHRLVYTVLKCRDCGGKKRYTDQYGYTHPGCRLCSSTGRVKLQFVETTIAPASVVWHSPVGWRHSSGHFGNWREWPEHHARDWSPNQPGSDLTPDQAAESLLAVERYFPARPPKRSLYDCDDYYGEADDFASYSLYIGATDPNRCAVCGSSEESKISMYGCSQGRVTWTATVCETSRVLWGDGIWQRLKFNFPHELITPHVRLWIQTHPTKSGAQLAPAPSTRPADEPDDIPL